MSSTNGWLTYQAVGWPAPGPNMQALADTVVQWAAAQPLNQNRAPLHTFDRELMSFIGAQPDCDVLAAVTDSNLLRVRIDGLKLERTSYDTISQFMRRTLYTIIKPVAFHAYYAAHDILDARKADAAARRARTSIATGKRVTLVTSCDSYYIRPS